MPSETAANLKVTWNYGHRGGLAEDSIEVWVGDERIARFSGHKEAMDMCALALLDLRTQPEIVKRTDTRKMSYMEMAQEVDALRYEILERQRRLESLQDQQKLLRSTWHR